MQPVESFPQLVSELHPLVDGGEEHLGFRFGKLRCNVRRFGARAQAGEFSPGDDERAHCHRLNSSWCCRAWGAPFWLLACSVLGELFFSDSVQQNVTVDFCRGGEFSSLYPSGVNRCAVTNFVEKLLGCFPEFCGLCGVFGDPLDEVDLFKACV